MVRVWAKKMRKSHILEDYVAQNDRTEEDFLYAIRR